MTNSFCSRAYVFKVAFVVGALGLAGVLACSDDGDDDGEALCLKTCDKVAACNPGAESFLQACKNQCLAPTPGGTMTCTNASAIAAKAKECLNATCAAWESCVAAIPACQGSPGGTGGVPGTGLPGTGGVPGTGLPGTGGVPGTGLPGTGGVPGTGLPGTGGSAGMATDCSVCAKADACCGALANLQGQNVMCTLATTCAEAGDNKTTAIQACEAVLAAAKPLNLPACN
ncbi:MAG: hypothetical protein KA712_04705 [Myxococcales bacterium]|nr:hypothetical protein [Myxococcales bacterium]